ncbi:elongator complex protein 4-like isoform X2 [Xenia sp. Carnegie-2017]|nr:elongator complex protein 4-like isoform X2 [Xenia sp. Carnegie-2017]XP_046863598.1 elongator complex protein 4-like isoform X2 [Xenia sp. Carnegie-2017]
MRCFLAEGVVSEHSLFLATADENPTEMWKNLPRAVNDVNYEKNNEGKLNSSQEEEFAGMKIAWRYENMSKVDLSPAPTKFGHFFDFIQRFDETRIDKLKKYGFCARDQWFDFDKEQTSEKRSLLNPFYKSLLDKLCAIIQENGHCSSNTEIKDETILRVAIPSMDADLWCYGDGDDTSLPMFLYYLRGVVRSSYSACFVTIPSHVYQDTTFASRIERLCDVVIKLESFSGSEKETNPMFKDYHGLFYIVRLSRLNSLTRFMPETMDFGFKLRRRKFIIEKLHLPPSINETEEDKKNDFNHSNNLSYGTGSTLGGCKLNF